MTFTLDQETAQAFYDALGSRDPFVSIHSLMMMSIG